MDGKLSTTLHRLNTSNTRTNFILIILTLGTSIKSNICYIFSFERHLSDISANRDFMFMIHKRVNWISFFFPFHHLHSLSPYFKGTVLNTRLFWPSYSFHQRLFELFENIECNAQCFFPIDRRPNLNDNSTFTFYYHFVDFFDLSP